jgi:DNA-binding NtrC family response regulator
VGSNKTLSADVRLVAATNKNLEDLVKANKFREDLFYRLRGFEIMLPPLRARTEDIPLLARTFLREFAVENRKEISTITPETMDILVRFPWPGNVRELRTTMETAVVTCKSDRITPRDLPLRVRQEGAAPPSASSDGQKESNHMTVEEAEKQLIIRALKQAKGNRTLAAKQIGISRRTLHRKLKLYKLEAL